MLLKHIRTGREMHLGYVNEPKGGCYRVAIYEELVDGDATIHKDVNVRGKAAARALVREWLGKMAAQGYRLVKENGEFLFIELPAPERAAIQMVVHAGVEPTDIPDALAEVYGESVNSARRVAVVAYATTVKRNIPLNKPHDQMDALADQRLVARILAAAKA